MKENMFKGNERLPPPDAQYQYTVEELREFVKCSKDPIYFINHYVKIIELDKGLSQFTLWPFQEQMVKCYHENRFSITMASRQVGKSTTVVAFFLWFILFNTNVRACISANKQKTAIDLLSRLKLAYENLPRFLQQGVVAWAKMEIIIANGSSVFAAATSSSAVRGGSYNCVAGQSLITVCLDGEIITLPIEMWHTAIANSSRHTKTLNTDVFLDGIDYDVLRQQIYQLVSRTNETKKRLRDVEQGEKEIEPRCSVLTNKGFKAFDGIRRTKLQSTIRVILADNTTLECTPDHQVYLSETRKCAAKNLRGKYIRGVLGPVKVLDIVDGPQQDVYDVLNVEETHNFFANNILVSNCLLLDEFAFVPENIANEFYASTFPTITSGRTTKIIMVSTPNGMNLFHKFWSESQSGDNDFVSTVAHWSDVPGRDEQWKLETIRNIGGPEKFAQEMDLSFLSTSYTLIRSQVLQTLTHKQPLATSETGYAEFVPPDKSRSYVMTVDTASGQGLDYSTFVIVDVTEMPYQVVATYANNRISTMEFPQVIMQYSKRYFTPWLMVEVMDIGRDVAFILSRDHEYEKLMTAVMEKRLGQRLTFNAKINRHLGLRMTAGVKRSGCAVLKTLVENRHLILNDYRIIQQLSVFVQKASIYMAETGHHDDLVMPLVMLGWISLQPNFAEVTTTRALDSYTRLMEESKENLVSVSVPDERPTPVGVFTHVNEDDDTSWLF